MVYSGGEQELNKFIQSHPEQAKKFASAGLRVAANNPQMVATVYIFI